MLNRRNKLDQLLKQFLYKRHVIMLKLEKDLWYLKPFGSFLPLLDECSS